MRILLSAIACHPEHGSEGGVGWKAAVALAREHEIHVLTSTANQKSIESALSATKIPNLCFTYFGQDSPYHENRLIARGQSWLRYLAWMKESLPQARRLLSKQTFDVIHHVTYSSWRVPSPLWQLGIPFIWGPIGGVATYPIHLMGKLSLRSAAFELLRSASNALAARSPSLRRCIRNSSAIVASNRETLVKLAGLRGHSSGLHLLSPSLFTQRQMEEFACDPRAKGDTEPMRMFAGGNLIGPKGVVFALEAVRMAMDQGVPCRFLIASGGPEVSFLKKQARRLGLNGLVEFHLGFSGMAYIEKLKEAHVFLLPSFRENAPGTILEAMLSGCVPIVVDASAQGEIVNADYGFKIPPGAAYEISEGLANALVTLHRQPAMRVAMGTRAAKFVQEHFSEENYERGINAVYGSLAAGSPPSRGPGSRN